MTRPDRGSRHDEDAQLEADLDRMNASTTDLDDDGQPQAAPGPIRRYVLLERIGVGGMGAVYTAYDARLDRKVALKVLHREGSPQARARFLREAQALARLNHPNVVTAFDAGAVGERPYLAMELVEGASLRSWLAEKRRGWREIVRVFLAAGRGLAAAHAAGLVHRDVKPDNILVGRDGSVQVADFGVVGFRGVPEPAAGAPDETSPGSVVTAADALVGTPRYMAPERRPGAEVDPRADQYSFCVSLREALHGTGAPGWLRRIAERGAAGEPADRYPSMEALLVDLGKERGRSARVVLVALLPALAVGAVALAMRPRADPCAGAGRELDGAWNPERKSALSRRFLATGLPFAGVAAERAARALDEWTVAYARGRVDACRASDEPRATCLADLAGEAHAKIDTLVVADRQSVARVDDLVSTLPDVRDCAAVTPEAAGLRLPRERDRRLQVMIVRSNLYSASALSTAGKSRAAADLAQSALTAARTLAHRPTIALALLVDAVAVGKLGDWHAAEQMDVEAMDAAASVGDDGTFADAAADLAVLLVSLEPRLEEARRYARLAIAVAQHAGLDRRTIQAEYALGEVELVAGHLEEAQRSFAAGLALAEERVGPEDVLTCKIVNGLGMVASERGDQQASLAHFGRALEVRTRVSGGQHRTVADERMNIGNVLAELGRLREARTAYQAALAIDLAVLGARHGQTANTLVNLAFTEVELGASEAALGHIEEALPVMEATFGAESLSTGGAHRAHALALAAAGRVDEARAEAARSLAIVEKADPAHPLLIDALESVAAVEETARRYADATAALERAVAIAGRVEGGATKAPRLHARLAWLALLAGDARRARAQAEEARRLAAPLAATGFVPRNAGVAIAAALVDEDPSGAALRLRPLVVAAAAEIAEGVGDRGFEDLARFALARADWAQAHGDRPAARRLVAQALAGFQAEHDQAWAERAERWLKER